MTRKAKIILVSILAAVGIGIGISVSQTNNNNDQSTKPAAVVPNALTGSINLTCSQGGCGNFAAKTLNGPLQLDSIYINCDNVLAANGQKYDCLKFGPLATGTTGPITIISNSMDGIKITGGHDLTIGGEGSSITCPSGNVNHKDAIQVVGPASNLIFVGINANCLDAGNDQFFIDGLDRDNPPTHIYYVDGVLKPTASHFHTVTINNSIDSGVLDSTICPNATSNPYQIGPYAVTPIDPHDPANGNLFPASC